jgi:hypothetical protein
MRTSHTVWCSKCFERIEGNDIRTVYNGLDYQQHCFMKVVSEEAEEQRTRRYQAERSPAVHKG